MISAGRSKKDNWPRKGHVCESENLVLAMPWKDASIGIITWETQGAPEITMTSPDHSRGHHSPYNLGKYLDLQLDTGSPALTPSH